MYHGEEREPSGEDELTPGHSLESSSVFLLNGNEQHLVFQLCVEAPGIHSYRRSVIDRTSIRTRGDPTGGRSLQQWSE